MVVNEMSWCHICGSSPCTCTSASDPVATYEANTESIAHVTETEEHHQYDNAQSESARDLDNAGYPALTPEGE